MSFRWMIGAAVAAGLSIDCKFASETQPIPDLPPTQQIRTIAPINDALHLTGQHGSQGIEVNYKRDQPGFVLSRLKDPLLLEEGFYRMTFSLRRGHYPSKGLLHKTYGLFKLEVWDITAKKMLAQRELQIADFPSPNQYEHRWIDFSMRGRKGHAIEPRVRWLGLANGEIGPITVERFAESDNRLLERRAWRFNELQNTEFLENGFVVSRKHDGTPDETGDATTYTGYWVAALAWKYALTKDAHTYQRLENGIATLHRAIKGTERHPVITRYVDATGVPFPKIPSKDVYTSFFLAYSAAYPHIADGPLRNQMRDDVDRLASALLVDGLSVKTGDVTAFDLTPYFTTEEIQDGIRKMASDKKKMKKIIRALKTSQRAVPIGDLWPGMSRVIKAMEKRDETQLLALALPTTNSAFVLLERVRDILREQYRRDLLPVRTPNPEYPGIKLSNHITDVLRKFPKQDNNERLRQLSDLKVLASNALIALHIVKTAAIITGKQTYIDYYQTNLYTQDALLKTALDWYGKEDEFTTLIAGNPTANAERRGYLAALSLMNLWNLETNPAIKESYRQLLVLTRSQYRFDDNPFIEAIYCNVSTANDSPAIPEQVAHALMLYPENREGFGPDYWEQNGQRIADLNGGELPKGYAAEALPVSHRPKDSFLWQRNARQLRGDTAKRYPITDYLFVYWFGRYTGVIPAPEPTTTVQY